MFRTLLLLPALFAAALAQYCPAADEVFINAGGDDLSNNRRCDIPKYASPGSAEYAVPQVKFAAGCTAHYFSHRYASNGNLVYTIPVPAGTYTVHLFFMETFHTSSGKRTFFLDVNGVKPFAHAGLVDIFAITKAKNKPYQMWTYDVPVTAASKTIKVTITRSAGDPMISAINIKGPGANALVGSTGLKCGIGGGTGGGISGGGGGGDNSKTGTLTPVGNSVKSIVGKAVFGTGVPCPGANDVFINAGGKNLANGYRCDTGKFSSAGKLDFQVTGTLGGTCSASMFSHAYTFGTSLKYEIPVTAGTYKVGLYFMETFFTAPGQRLFKVSVNGQALSSGQIDIFALAGGKNKPYEYTMNVATNSLITIVLTKGTKDNPFISGITVSGISGTSKVKANNFVGTEGLTSCGAGSPTTGGSTGTPGGGKCATEFKGDHLAHAVAKGPYVETDFKSQGFACLTLDGSGSHSHAFQSGNGQIVSYSWSWVDKTNPDAVSGVVTLKKEKSFGCFPVGVTDLTLEVTDQFGNCASETTTVTVKSKTSPGAYCYYYNFFKSAPLEVPIFGNIASGDKPQFAFNAGDINFKNTAQFGKFIFSGNSFAVRCVFQVAVPTAGNYKYSIAHNGPIKVFQGTSFTPVVQSKGYGQKSTMTPSKFFAAGTHSWQVLYFRKEFEAGFLQFKNQAGAVLPATVITHDASTTLPVITGVSDASSFAGSVISLFGSAFVNGVVVKFGSVVAQTASTTAGVIEVLIPTQPTGASTVDITVTTGAGVSNAVPFAYGASSSFCDVPKWQETSLKSGNSPYIIGNIAVIRYGPDGRLYLGSQENLIHALTINQNLQVTKTCTKNIQPTGARRWVLGIAFSPKTTQLKMYFTTSTMFFIKLGLGLQGWKNGKIQSVDVFPNNGCFGPKVSDVVTGLPVSNHDHGINFLEFLPSGMLLVGVAGTTNGGVSTPGDLLGGIPATPYSGAILQCPVGGTTNIKYSNDYNPAGTQVFNGGQCDLYAPGFRNTFGARYHTNGWLYAMDNGPNKQFGKFSTNCKGGSTVDKNTPDRFFKVQPGKCHGHPNLSRGKSMDLKQCVFRHPQCVKPLNDKVDSSTNGVLEYRSNVFNGIYKSNIFLTKFADSSNKKGQISRVQLTDNGNQKAFTKKFWGDSGLSVAEGPRGEIVMSRVFKSEFFVLKPVCMGTATSPYLIGVHPKMGPASGGHTVLLSGFKFGAGAKVFFGSKSCVVSQATAEFIICKTPSATANTQVKVTVVAADGSETMHSGTDYWYM